jgi:membrane-bound ClpP family serine protease
MPPVAMPPSDIWLTNLHALITLGNVVLLLCLLGLYVKNYEQIKSKFALGLIAFVILLLVQAFMSHPFVHLLWGFQLLYALGLLRIVAEWFEFAALAILLYISLKPE